VPETMVRMLIDFGAGVLVGGLSVSAGWGLFWLGIGLVGLARGTCGWRVVANGLTVGLLPLFLIAGLVWWTGGTGAGPAFGAGLLGVPIVLCGLAWRQAPDGRRAGRHLLAGVRRLMDDLLGRHRGCGGCDHEHHHEGRP
jgi:hypothetical protein